MKKTAVFLSIMLITMIGCNKQDAQPYEGLDGFCVMVNDKVLIDINNIEFYDYSSHLIYLKDNNQIVETIDSSLQFKVYAQRQEIYTGNIVPGYSSMMYFGAVIRTMPRFYKDNIVSIDFNYFIDEKGNKTPDVRENKLILDVLRMNEKLHLGLSCEIKAIKYLSSDNIVLELLLKNNDSFNYYYLDPEKMGYALFHYFTNGLILYDNKTKIYENKLEQLKPEPWNMWNKDWLSIINANSSKLITIVYNNFENIPNGKYTARFVFPGLSHQVDKKDIKQKNGYIWLGNTEVSTDITIKP